MSAGALFGAPLLLPGCLPRLDFVLVDGYKRLEYHTPMARLLGIGLNSLVRDFEVVGVNN